MTKLSSVSPPCPDFLYEYKANSQDISTGDIYDYINLISTDIYLIYIRLRTPRKFQNFQAFFEKKSFQNSNDVERKLFKNQAKLERKLFIIIERKFQDFLRFSKIFKDFINFFSISSTFSPVYILR